MSRQHASTISASSVSITLPSRLVRWSWLIAALVVLVAAFAGCGGEGGGGSSDERHDVPDFTIVPYQQSALLGDAREMSIAAVFEGEQPVVLNLWGAECPPCRAEMPAFQTVADEFEGQAVVLGLDVGAFTALGTHEGARQLIAELGIRYPNAYAVDNAVLKRYLVHGMPTTLFFDDDGELIEKHQGPLSAEQLRAKLAKLIDE